jgi:G3E family GTPase
MRAYDSLGPSLLRPSVVPSPDHRIPAFLLTGFLGSGKTTLLNALLRTRSSDHTAVVINEVGEVGIDQLIVAQASDTVMLLDSGCLCCLDSGALHETLSDLIAQRASGRIPAFQRVVIETSGAADPAPLINTLLGHPLVRPHYRAVATVATVDAQHFGDTLDRSPELARQVALADRLVLTRGDLATPEQAQSAQAQATALNPEAGWWVSSPARPALDVFDDDGGTAGLRVIGRSTDPGDRPAVSLLAPRSLAPLHAQGSRIRSIALRPTGPVTWASWAAWSRLLLASLGDRLLRAKGLLQLADTGEIVCVQIVQRVIHRPLRLPDWPDADRTNRLVCIGLDLSEDEIRATLPTFEIAPGTPTDSLAPHPAF